MKIEKAILGKRICLRNYTESDITFLTDMWFDEENGKYMSDPTREYVDETFQKIVAMDEYWADDGEAPKQRQNMNIGRKIK